jgi:hypothetical protein
MAYKIEMKYFYGWDDAGWTDEIDFESKPTRFFSVRQARAALGEFFAEVKAAVHAGNMDVEENGDDYRIVEASE